MKKTQTLMERLLEAGYPREEMQHSYSDLYVYVTPLTTMVIKRWCEKNNYREDSFVTKFKDRITGKQMYRILFQYDPYWEEKMARRK